MPVLPVRLVEWVWTRLRRPPRWLDSGPFSEVCFQPGEVAIDCGANLGDVTLALARRGAVVYAFEPNPYAFRELRRRTASLPGVHSRNAAVLDRAGAKRLFFHKNAAANQLKWASGSSMLACKSNIDPQSGVDVEVVDLAAFMDSLQAPIKLLKIDVEGVECSILNRLIDTGWAARINHIFVETHERKIPELQAETAALRQRIAEEGLTHIRLDWE